ncbi:MAG TPA: hypothetical protein VJ044_18985 [Candidatus Hodarchaeales archaeon]|nr:hypothetical protein [Candidatus Hodarchaeales archaeon]
MAKKPEPMHGTYWGYFAPDGFLQVRTIGETKEESRKFLPGFYEAKTWRDYEGAGWTLKRIIVDIAVDPVQINHSPFTSKK